MPNYSHLSSTFQFSLNPDIIRVLYPGNRTCICNVMESFRWFKLRKLSNYTVIFRNGFCCYAAEQFSDDEYECDYENHPESSSVVNIDEGKWKLSMLFCNDKDQVVSRDKRDRRDFEQISGLAKHMGLYCELYGKVVVASKVPHPNYRPDLDDNCPQIEERAVT